MKKECNYAPEIFYETIGWEKDWKKCIIVTVDN